MEATEFERQSDAMKILKIEQICNLSSRHYFTNKFWVAVSGTNTRTARG
jgi:hypothetical protein